MKRIIFFLAILAIFSLNSCSVAKYILNEGDATAALREMLSLGAGAKALISKGDIMKAILPDEVSGILNGLQQFGLGGEAEKLTNTLTVAATETAEKSIPVFLLGIKKMNFNDGIGIVKGGGTSATNYLRNTIGDTLRMAVAPIMKIALDKYNLSNQLSTIVQPLGGLLGNQNLKVEYLLAGVVTNAMFNKIAEKEVAIRTRAEARTSQLLQRVFGSATLQKM